jgi:hypothetical protein
VGENGIAETGIHGGHSEKVVLYREVPSGAKK